MSDLKTMLEHLYERGDLEEVRQDARVQFGPPEKERLGATIMPEEDKNSNIFREDHIRFHEFGAARLSDRKSPPQVEDRREEVGSYMVELATMSNAGEFDSDSYDNVKAALQEDNITQEALAEVVDFFASLNESLAKKAEVQRWDCLITGSVDKMDGTSLDYPHKDETVSEVGQDHIQDAAVKFDGNSDPLQVFENAADLLEAQNYPLGRVIMSKKARRALLRNTNLVQAYFGTDLGDNRRSLRVSQLNELMDEHDLPEIETYDVRYRDADGNWERYLDEEAVLFLGETGEERILDVGEQQPRILPNVVGYYAIGIPAGESQATKVLNAEVDPTYPPSISGQAVQVGLPVLQDPFAVVVRTNVLS